MADDRKKGAGGRAQPAAETAPSAEGIVHDAEMRMQRAIEVLHDDLNTIRTGRATPSMLDRITVDYYGVPTPINQVANISAPEPRLLVIQPWDRGLFGPIEKAIQKSDLGINPTNDGNVIRLAVPMLTEQRRKEMVKVVQRRAEEGRVAIRNCRRDALERLKRGERERTISEDESKRFQERLQRITDRCIAEVDRVATNKEKEVLEV